MVDLCASSESVRLAMSICMMLNASQQAVHALPCASIIAVSSKVARHAGVLRALRARSGFSNVEVFRKYLVRPAVSLPHCLLPSTHTTAKCVAQCMPASVSTQRFAPPACLQSPRAPRHTGRNPCIACLPWQPVAQARFVDVRSAARQWYLLRERKFDDDAVQDLVALKAGLGMSDGEVRSDMSAVPIYGHVRVTVSVVTSRAISLTLIDSDLHLRWCTISRPQPLHTRCYEMCWHGMISDVFSCGLNASPLQTQGAAGPDRWPRR